MRVLRILTRPNVGGPMQQAIALWHAQAALGLRTLLVVGRCAADEASVVLARTGIPLLTRDAVGPGAAGLLEVDALQRGPHPLHDLRAGAALRALIRAFQPDVVHTHTSKAGLLGRRAALAERVPIVAHTFHGHVLRDYWLPPVGGVLRRIERSLARRTDLLVAVSPSCARELAQLGVTERARVIPPAVDLRGIDPGTRDSARAELGLEPGVFVVGFVGRLVRIKRPDLLLEVLGTLPGAQALVLGDGPLRSWLERRAGPRARFLGASSALPRLLPALDALLIPSEREGCPLAAIEAFAARVPVVGFDVPGVRDVLGEWGAGVLVPRAAGALGLTVALREVLAAPERAPRVAAEHLARFTPATVARTLAEAYAGATR